MKMSSVFEPFIPLTSRILLPVLWLGSLIFFSACSPAPEESAPAGHSSPESVPPAVGRVRISGDAEIPEQTPGQLTVRLLSDNGRATVTFDFRDGLLDLSHYQNLALRMDNETVAPLDVFVTGLSSLENQWANRTQGRMLVRPGEENAELLAFMKRRGLLREHPLFQTFGNMHGLPGGHHRHWELVDPANILRVTVRIDWAGAEAGQTLRLGHPHGSGAYSVDPGILDAIDFPVLDRFGQMRGREWPEKVHSADELLTDAEADLALAAEHKGFGPGLSRFGGFASGERLESTGFFRVEKIGGHWWFVDPDGYPFWSVGANSVARGGETRVDGRERLFPEGLSGVVDFHENNLALKYGEDWVGKHVDVTLARMKQWGMNTVGAWSRADLFETERMPFTIQVHTAKEGVGGIGKMPDPFDTRFRDSLERRLAALAEDHAENPWLLGIFIHNELDWGGGIRLGEEILGSGRNRPARRAAVQQLEERYGDIASLNAIWGTDFSDFASVRPLEEGNPAYREDVRAIMDRFASRYFQICRELMRQYFPNHLYLGCRFHTFNPIILRAASRYQDVVSLNIYQFGVADFSVEMDDARPILIGEFHFGIGDHGHWGRGLRAAANAGNQADLFRLYMEEALRHPQMVGAHWFAWSDQPATGRRSDGENFGVGLVSIVDRPHRPLTDAVRNVSRGMYDLRLNRVSEE